MLDAQISGVARRYNFQDSTRECTRSRKSNLESNSIDPIDAAYVNKHITLYCPTYLCKTSLKLIKLQLNSVVHNVLNSLQKIIMNS